MNYLEKIDYSSLSCYLECPRKFLFQYLLNLRPAAPSIHLVFGSAWHYGLERAYTAMGEGETGPERLRDISVLGFNALWAIEADPDWDPDLVFPKSPGHAANMYDAYWRQYAPVDGELKVVGVEVPFRIALQADLPSYVGRLDLVLENAEGDLVIVDHKTTKSVSAITYPSFECSLQTDGYLTAGHLFYDRIPRILYSVALCQKSKIAFARYEVIKSRQMLDVFLEEASHHVREIVHRGLPLFEKALESATARNDLPRCFRRKPGYACTAYFTKCPFYDICHLRPNPLLWRDNPPQGYVVAEWDPDLHEQSIKERLDESAQEVTA